jgi:hypothetical protein
MVMKARERLYGKYPAFFSFILSTMTAPSRAVVQGHPDFLEAHTSSDVFSLLRIVKGTHLINLEAEAMRMEKKLQEMRLGVEDFTTYASKFHDLIIGLDNLCSKLSTERIVFIFLFSLKSSPLQGAADRLLDDPEPGRVSRHLRKGKEPDASSLDQPVFLHFRYLSSEIHAQTQPPSSSPGSAPSAGPKR